MARREADAKGALEADFILLETIDGHEVLGYRGEGREEHSGENAPMPFDDPCGGLADNLPAQIILDELAKL